MLTNRRLENTNAGRLARQSKAEKALRRLPRFPSTFTSTLRDYWSSLVISCCDWLACDSAAMPVWLRIWYFDMSDVA